MVCHAQPLLVLRPNLIICMSYIVYIGESVVHSTDGPEILFTNGETADSSPFDQPGRPIRRRAFSIFYDQLLIVGRGASHRLRRKQLSSRTAARPSIEVQLRGRRVGANGGTAVIGFDYTEPLESQANRKAFRAPFVSLHFRRLLVVSCNCLRSANRLAMHRTKTINFFSSSRTSRRFQKDFFFLHWDHFQVVVLFVPLGNKGRYIRVSRHYL